MQKTLSRTLLVAYLMILVWLVLFKLAGHLSGILHYHHRSLNLVPFAAPSRINGRTNYGEILFNCIFFIPFGLLLNVNFKSTGFLAKLALIVAFSVTAELIQYIFAIGATDITDVITNTSGGLIGLTIYGIGRQFTDERKLDRFVVIAGILLLILFLLFRSRVTFSY